MMIDTNIPIPSRKRYPFTEMNVGDSFHVPLKKWHSVRQLAYHYGREMNYKFTIRKADDNYRCWRIK